jgi:hypothetical protein
MHIDTIYTLRDQIAEIDNRLFDLLRLQLLRISDNQLEIDMLKNKLSECKSKLKRLEVQDENLHY